MWTWSVHQPDRNIDFNGFFWKRAGGNVLFDPMPLDDSEINFVMQQGGARWILLTNADHQRWAAEAKERFGARVIAHEEERERFGEDADLVDTWLGGDVELTRELADDIRVHELRGGKSPAEPALELVPLNALLFGDLVRSHASGNLCLLPDAKLTDRAAALESLKPLADLEVEAVLLGDGDSLFRGGAEALRELIGGD